MLKKRLSVDDTTIFAGQDDKESMWLYPPNRCRGYHLCLLGAVMMTLGCKIRPDFRKSLEELHTKVGFSRNAQVQLRHALNIYVDGTAYDFRSKSRPVGLDNDDWASDSMWGDLSESLCKLDDSVDPFMKQLARQMFGPLMKCVIAGDNEKPQDACGYCGNKKADDGSPCQPCSQCNQRLYCSRKWYAWLLFHIGRPLYADRIIVSLHTVLSTSWSATTGFIESWATLGPRLRRLPSQLKHRGLLRPAKRVARRLTTPAEPILHRQMSLLLRLRLLHQLPTAAMTLTTCLRVATVVWKQLLNNRFYCAESARNSTTATRNARSHIGLHTRGSVWPRPQLEIVVSAQC